MPDEPKPASGKDVQVDIKQHVGTNEGEVIGLKVGAMSGDVIHGNKTIIQHIIQRAVEKLTGSPYKFLSSYGLEDRDIFYGRDTVIEEIASRVLQHKVVIVNGASGSGKTSLVNAGILPRLAEHGYTFIDFREYSDPLAQVRSYLTGHGLIQVTEDATLLEILTAFRDAQETKLVVVFDQFERFLVNVKPKTRRVFIGELKACMASFSAEEMNVVIVLRQDWLGQMYAEIEEVIPEFGVEAYRYNLKALGRAEAREAVIRPLEQVEAKIGYDEAFVDEVLLGSLAQEGEQDTINPPHLQIVCHQLFEEAHRRYQDKGGMVVIDEALYDELGGVEEILNSYLDRTVEEIAGSAEKVAVVRSMLKAMVETTGTRKFVSLEDLGGALPDVNEAEIVKLLERLSVRRVTEERDQRNSLSHEYMVGQVRSWFDVRELERRKARETLDRGLAAWQTSQSLLDERQVAHIRQWLGALSEEEEALLAKSRRRHVLERWVKIGAVVVLIAVAALSVVLWQMTSKSLIAATAASIVNTFDADTALGEEERDALWTLAAEDEAVRTQVLGMFLRTGPNAGRFNAHSEYLLQALLGIDPEHRIGPLEEAVSQYCTVPDLDQIGKLETCVALGRQLEQVPQGFPASIIASIEREEDSERLLSLVTAFSSLGERVDADDVLRVASRLVTLIEEEEDSERLSELVAAFALLGERVDAGDAVSVASRLVTLIEEEEDSERLLYLVEAFASLGERVDAVDAVSVASRLVTAIEKEQDSGRLSYLVEVFASLGERVDAGDAVRIGSRLVTAIEKEQDSQRLWELVAAFASLGERVDAGDAVRIGSRLVTAIEEEEDSERLLYLVEAFASLGERVDADDAVSVASRLVTLIEKKEDSRGLPNLVAAFASLGERVDADDAVRIGSRLVTAIEKEQDSQRLWNLVEVFASLGERVDAGDAVRIGSRLVTAIEKEQDPYRLGVLVEVFASLGERVDAGDAVRIASRLVTAIEKEQDPYRLGVLVEVFASLGERVDAGDAVSVASRLVTAMEKEQDSRRLWNLVEVFASLEARLENDRLVHLLKQPICCVELQRVLIEMLAAKAKEEDLAAVGLTVTGDVMSDFVLDRWKFARWAKQQGFDIAMITDPSKAWPAPPAQQEPEEES